MARMPAAEVDVDEPLVRRLLADQHPDLAALPLRLLANGWDNVIWRLGDDLVVRAPRRAAAAGLIENEQRWLPRLAAHLPVRIPVPVRLGRPTAYYPWSWTVGTWTAGVSAAVVPAAARDSVAEPLAEFLLALHRPAPADAPHNPVRGVPLGTRDRAVRERLAGGAVPDAARVAALWDDLSAAPPWTGTSLWLHGDLHPANLVLDADGALAAVIDFGDLTAGDPATDLATAWLTFDDDARRRFVERVHDGARHDDATWARARGWALSLATALLAHSDDAPVLGALGRETLARVLTGPDR
ncbi:aminoglycoside phosphotransferase family protein [Georgenia subflava]|uniref:Phosphotransferase n=1 Tax=Georgenia subflava TaxID=1622177 RepID=A0A6N7EKG0_9MICO|nr:aminoglycoside phosphotransferase family protein [Georgenia subflava]MPV38550.1 phosphotransferase [Georgenia subflava]